MTNGQQRLIDGMRKAGWQDVTSMPPTRPGGIGADGHSPDGYWHIHIDGDRHDGLPNQYRLSGDGPNQKARTFHARGKVPTPDQAIGAYGDARAAEATNQAAAKSGNGRQV